MQLTTTEGAGNRAGPDKGGVMTETSWFKEIAERVAYSDDKAAYLFGRSLREGLVKAKGRAWADRFMLKLAKELSKMGIKLPLRKP